jgi:hypothetical protein
LALSQSSLVFWQNASEIWLESLLSEPLGAVELSALAEVAKQAKSEGLLSLQNSKFAGLPPSLVDAFRWVASGKDPIFANDQVAQYFGRLDDLDDQCLRALISLKGLVLNWGIFSAGFVGVLVMAQKNELGLTAVLELLLIAFFCGEIALAILLKQLNDWIKLQRKNRQTVQQGIELILTGGSFELFYQSYLAQIAIERKSSKS